MSGCVLITLVFNAPTTKLLIDYLNMLKQHKIKDEVFKCFLDLMQQSSIDQEVKLRSDHYLQTCDWDQVLFNRRWGNSAVKSPSPARSTRSKKKSP